MDGIHVINVIALAAGAVGIVALLLVGALVWFLNHPSD
jgi:hypothetical protein